MNQGTSEKRKIDDLDRKIILELQEDARRQFKVIAIKLNVSESTVKNRVTRLISRGVLKLEARVDPFAVPHKVAAVVGINLKERNYNEKMEEIEKMPGVTSVWKATGRFDLFFEIMVDSLSSLNDIVFGKYLETIGGIAHIETFVLLSSNTKYFKLL
ncbi:MAG: Lrp/AsnC family transcriptional regulator [bacterium]|nr:Lrp/AsnC family transcriptional regulator [bacterium]